MRRTRPWVLGLALMAALVPACGTSEPATRQGNQQVRSSSTPVGPISGMDLKRLPLGDGAYSSSAKTGSIFSCQTQFLGGGAFANGPWIHADNTWDSTSKIEVAGDISWPNNSYSITLDANLRHISSNALPAHHTGIFPISSSDPAYRYDRNPNRIQPRSIAYALPSNPRVAARPSCLGMGPIGIMLSGSLLYDAFDAAGRDAVAHELQDGCQGHPDPSGAYHYHSLSSCIDKSGRGRSKLVGYALDGFGIFGPSDNGDGELTDTDLDECHGRVDTITWDGVSTIMYHYVATREFPYTLGCFRGTPVMSREVASLPRGTANAPG